MFFTFPLIVVIVLAVIVGFITVVVAVVIVGAFVTFDSNALISLLIQQSFKAPLIARCCFLGVT